MSPSTVIPGSSIPSRSPPHSWFPEGEVSSMSLDKGDATFAGLGSKHRKAVVEPMRACRHSRKALSTMSPDSNDELGPQSSYSLVTRGHFGQPIHGPPVLARNARGRERSGFSGSMKAVRVNEKAVNDERLVALARKLLCMKLSDDVILLDKTESIAYHKQMLDPSICGIILLKDYGATSVKIIETGEVLRVEPYNRLGGPDGDGKIILVVKKPDKTAYIYGTPPVQFMRRVTLEKDFELFEHSADNWEAIEEAAKIDYEYENFAKEEAEAKERGRRSDAERKSREKEREMESGQQER